MSTPPRSATVEETGQKEALAAMRQGDWSQVAFWAPKLTAAQAEDLIGDWIDALNARLSVEAAGGDASDRQAQLGALAGLAAVARAQRAAGAFADDQRWFGPRNRQIILENAMVLDGAQALCDLLSSQVGNADALDERARPADLGVSLGRAGLNGQREAVEWMSRRLGPVVDATRSMCARQWVLSLRDLGREADPSADAAALGRAKQARNAKEALGLALKAWPTGAWTRQAQRAATTLPAGVDFRLIKEIADQAGWGPDGGALVFAQAAASGRAELCAQLAQAGAQVNSPLSQAHPARAGQARLLEELARLGVDFAGSTRALASALLCPEEEKAKETFEKILSTWGAPQEGLDAALSAAARSGRIWALDALKNAGARVADWSVADNEEASEASGLLAFRDPLAEAAGANKTRAIEWLLAHGAPASGPDCGREAIRAALKGNHPEAAAALVDEKNAAWLLANQRGASPLSKTAAWQAALARARAWGESRELSEALQASPAANDPHAALAGPQERGAGRHQRRL